MGLIAYRSADGTEVESFSTDSAAWNAMRREPPGTYKMPGTNTPAVLKRSIRGLQFFAHRAGESVGSTEPMTEAHAAAQIALLRALRSFGLPAWVERSGLAAGGERWQADVFCVVGNRPIAFEVQLAAQTLDEYEARGARYASCGVECVWMVSPTRFMAYNKAVMHRTWRECKSNFPYGLRPALPNVAVVALETVSDTNSDADLMRVAVFPFGAPPGPPARMTLQDFAKGVVDLKLQYRGEQWGWV